MGIETTIKLNRFVPRIYQREICRAFESGYKKMVIVAPRRCLSGEAHITMSNGSYKCLKDIKVGDRVLSWDGEKFVEDVVKDIWQTEEKETYKVRSPGYLPLITSYDHKFAHTSSSTPCVRWDKLQDITWRRLLLNYAGISSDKRDGDLAELWGYLLSDGYVVGYQQPKFTNNNMVILERVAFLALKTV